MKLFLSSKKWGVASSRKGGVASSRRGVALVLTLMAVAVLTAMVTEFAYGIYMDTSALENWEASRRLSLVAKSGAAIAGKIISDNMRMQTYTYPGVLSIPFENVFEGSEERLLLVIEDENGKFNINTIVYQNDLENKEAMNSFRRLLRHLTLDENIADKVADWIDRNSGPRYGDFEEGAKNAPLDSPDELLVIPGLKSGVYDKLKPYITVWGDGNININGAEAPVLMSLLDEETAKRIVERRKTMPLANSDISNFIPVSMVGRITVKSTAFRIVSEASMDGIIRTIECVVDASDASTGNIIYWKET